MYIHIGLHWAWFKPGVLPNTNISQSYGFLFHTPHNFVKHNSFAHNVFTYIPLTRSFVTHTHTTLSRATLSHTTLSRRISLSHTHFACNFVAHISLTRNVVTHNIPQLCRTQSMPHATPLHATSLSLSLRVWRALLACACSRVRRGPLPSRFCCLGPGEKTTALPIVASRLRRRVRWQCPGHAPGAVAGSGLPPLMCSCRPAKGRHETLLGCPTACKKRARRLWPTLRWGCLSSPWDSMSLNMRPKRSPAGADKLPGDTVDPKNILLRQPGVQAVDLDVWPAGVNRTAPHHCRKQQRQPGRRGPEAGLG